MSTEFSAKPNYWPRLSKLSLNLSSKQARRVISLLKGILVIYPLLFGMYLCLSIIGESYPRTWERLTALSNGMSFAFSLDVAGPLIGTSVILAIICIVIWAMIHLGWMRWQFSLSVLFGLGLWSLMYLLCGVIFLVYHDRISHVFVLLGATLLFMFVFIQNSPIRFYWSVKCYGDIVLEVIMALLFLSHVTSRFFVLFGG
ncbi:MAG: hypothetical protein ACJ8CR_06530 [Roseiflexaceae bacterium]